jgi:hypothetical protein
MGDGVFAPTQAQALQSSGEGSRSGTPTPAWDLPPAPQADHQLPLSLIQPQERRLGAALHGRGEGEEEQEHRRCIDRSSMLHV